MAEDVFGIVGTEQASAFRIDEVVAEGGFSVIYRARHQGFRADVALKCLRMPANLSAERQHAFLEKFREEGELLFRLSALIPPVVRPLQVGVLAGARGEFVPFLALEWLEGESLDALIAGRRGAGKAPLDLARAVKLLSPVARALERAHALPGPNGTVSVLHRDMKPENVFIAAMHGETTTKVLDFGIGTVKSHATQIAGRLSATDDVLGAFTPAYGAPEQWLPKRFGQTGPWTDVWGLALTLVEVVTGKPPLEGDAHALLGACIDEAHRPTPRALGVPVPDGVEAALGMALAVDPRRRYHDVGQFWDRIEHVVGARSARFGSSSTLDSILPDAAAAEPIPDLVLQMPAPPRAAPAGAEHAKPAPAPDALSLLRNHIPLAEPPVPRPRLERAAPAPEPSIGIDIDRSDLLRAPVPASRAGVARVRASSLTPERATRAVMSRLRGPARLIGLGIALMALDFAYATVTGTNFSLGPVRAFWIAGPLAGIGLVWMLRALLGD